MSYLAGIMMEEMADEYPHLTDEEIVAELGRQATARKIQWARTGKNPGLELVKLAQRRGWRYEAAQGQQQAQPERQQADPRQQVQQRKQQAAKARTISTVRGGGAASKGLTAKKLMALDDDAFEDQVRHLAKAQGRRKLPMSELLKGKGVQDSY
jgi:hypothetical protein